LSSASEGIVGGSKGGSKGGSGFAGAGDGAGAGAQRRREEEEEEDASVGRADAAKRSSLVPALARLDVLLAALAGMELGCWFRVSTHTHCNLARRPRGCWWIQTTLLLQRC
jgi:hypothetical protein